MTARYLTADRGPYDTRRAVLKVSNEIVPTTLDMTAYDDVATVPRARAEALALEAKATLESRLGLEFCRVNPAKFLCDETYARIEAARVADATQIEREDDPE